MQFGRWVGVALVCGSLAACGDDASTAEGSTTGSTTDVGANTSSPTATTGSDTSTAPTSGMTGDGTTGTSITPTTTTDDTTTTPNDDTTSTTSDDTTTGDGTSTGDAPPVCGDGEQDPGEACDDGPNNSDMGACTSACALATCGDGLVGPGEACDDANEVDSDDCTNTCALASCGDGVVQPGEDCDDADADETDDCLSTCVTPSCGDGFVQAGVEQCDDANQNDSDECTACKDATCDDGIKNGGESDVDCGGSCDGCGLAGACAGPSDCGDTLVCDDGACALPISCKALKAAKPDIASGDVTIDVDGGGPEASFPVYCEQTTFGGGWTRLMSAKYPHFFNDANWQNFNPDAPASENYSIVGKRDLFKNGASYTYRYAVGDALTWKDGPILFQVAWSQDHDAFTATTNGSDYTYLAGDKPTTCGGFNGLHNKYQGPSYATDVDTGDNLNCWWMQVVPRSDWHLLGYPPGYLHGFLGGNSNSNPIHETQWEVLYIRE